MPPKRSTTAPRLKSAATDIHAAVKRLQRGRPMHWVMVRDVGASLGLEDEALDAAVKQAIDKGLLISKGDPPHSVCLAGAKTSL